MCTNLDGMRKPCPSPWSELHELSGWEKPSSMRIISLGQKLNVLCPCELPSAPFRNNGKKQVSPVNSFSALFLGLDVSPSGGAYFLCVSKTPQPEVPNLVVNDIFLHT